MKVTKQEIEAVRIVAKSEGKTEIELLSFLQGAAAKIGDELTIEKLSAIKSVFIDEMMAA